MLKRCVGKSDHDGDGDGDECNGERGVPKHSTPNKSKCPPPGETAPSLDVCTPSRTSPFPLYSDVTPQSTPCSSSSSEAEKRMNWTSFTIHSRRVFKQLQIPVNDFVHVLFQCCKRWTWVERSNKACQLFWLTFPDSNWEILLEKVLLFITHQAKHLKLSISSWFPSQLQGMFLILVNIINFKLEKRIQSLRHAVTVVKQICSAVNWSIWHVSCS